MQKFSFFAMLSRMKYINRWGLMRNSRSENLSEHTLDVAYIAHALCVMSGVDPAPAVFAALYHDCTEILTGDLPTPVKYYTPDLRGAYRELEKTAAGRLLSTLPTEMADAYRPCFAERDTETARIVKAADKLSALTKCIEELRMGNHDFERAKQAQLDALRAMNMPTVDTFLERFIPAYELTLDELELSER